MTGIISGFQILYLFTYILVNTLIKIEKLRKIGQKVEKIQIFFFWQLPFFSFRHSINTQIFQFLESNASPGISKHPQASPGIQSGIPEHPESHK